MKLRWLTNICDPNLPDAKKHLPLSLHENRDEAWQYHLEWLSDKIIGEPVATVHRSVEELKRNNLVGIYKAD